jgi:hypothetical protein
VRCIRSEFTSLSEADLIAVRRGEEPAPWRKRDVQVAAAEQSLRTRYLRPLTAQTPRAAPAQSGPPSTRNQGQAAPEKVGSQVLSLRQLTFLGY